MHLGNIRTVIDRRGQGVQQDLHCSWTAQEGQPNLLQAIECTPFCRFVDVWAHWVQRCALTCDWVQDAGSGANTTDYNEDDDDAELAASLARARRMAKKRRTTKTAAGVAAAVQSMSTDSDRQTPQGLVFTSTSEFSRQIQSRMAEKRREIFRARQKARDP